MNASHENVLRAYVYQNLPDEERLKVRRWLMTVTDPTVLKTYEALIIQRKQREARLEYWMNNPALARLHRLWKTKFRPLWSEMKFELKWPVDEFSLAGGRLGLPTIQDTSRMILEAPVGQAVELTVRLKAPSYIAVFAIVDGGALHELSHSKNSKRDAGTIEIKKVTLEKESDSVEFIGLLDQNVAIPEIESGDGIEWLISLLEDWSSSGNDRSVIRASLASLGTDAPLFGA